MSRNHAKIGKGLSLSPVASRPSDPEDGDLIYNSANAQFEKYENGAWSSLSSVPATVSVSARNSSGQTIPNNLTTTITNWTEISDTSNVFNATTGIFTAPSAGLYNIFVAITFSDTVAASDRNVYITDATSVTILAHNIRSFNTGGSGQTTQVIMLQVSATASQQFAIQVSHAAGSNQSIVAAATRNTLIIQKV
jgi:hypothetical protein